MKRFIGVVVFLVLLAGCATGRVWVPTGNSEETQFKRDSYECRMQSRTAWVGRGLVGIALAATAAQIQTEINYSQCMQARGYTLQAK